MRVLGIDWGNRRIGLALSDPTGVFATPIVPISRSSDREDIEIIVILTQEHECDRIVIGMPLGIDGNPGETARSVESFIAKLEKAVDMPIIRIDERYSTHAADRALLEANLSRTKRKNIRDSVAAAWILQIYLDSLVVAAERT